MRNLFLLIFTALPLAAQLPAPNEAGVTLGHLHLMVSDPEAQKKVWVELLGAQTAHAGSLELLKVPGVFVVVGKARTAPGPMEGSSVNHVGFLVKSAAEMKAKLAAAKIEYTENAQTKQLMASFPEGVKVELTEDASLATSVAMHHIHEVSADPEKLRAWYAKLFGARAGMRVQWMAAFVPGGEVDFRKAEANGAPSKGRSLDHIGFEVRGLEAFCKKLVADGVVMESGYREMPQLDGLKIAFLVDPDGTRIELTEGLAGR